MAEVFSQNPNAFSHPWPKKIMTWTLFLIYSFLVEGVHFLPPVRALSHIPLFRSTLYLRFDIYRYCVSCSGPLLFQCNCSPGQFTLIKSHTACLNRLRSDVFCQFLLCWEWIEVMKCSWARLGIHGICTIYQMSFPYICQRDSIFPWLLFWYHQNKYSYLQFPESAQCR